jgi:hypothetical protein
VAVYNTAGEKVRSLYQGSVQYEPGSVSLSASVLSDGASVLVYFSGYLDDLSHTLSWNGNNDQGQAVCNGAYLVTLNCRDSDGVTITLTVQVLVARSGTAQRVAAYNSAGELVAPISTQGLGRLVDFTLPDGATFVSPVDGLGGSGLRILLRGADGKQAVTAWDGRDSSGNAVASGVYLLKLQDTQPGGAPLAVERSVMLIRGVGRLNTHGVLIPNPAGAGTAEVMLEYHPFSGCVASAQVFDLSGGRVCQVQSSAETGRLSIPVQGLSAGIYLVRFTQMQGGAVAGSSLLKLAVVH